MRKRFNHYASLFSILLILYATPLKTIELNNVDERTPLVTDNETDAFCCHHPCCSIPRCCSREVQTRVEHGILATLATTLGAGAIVAILHVYTKPW